MDEDHHELVGHKRDQDDRGFIHNSSSSGGRLRKNVLTGSVPFCRELQQDAVGGFRMHKDLWSSFSDQLCAGVLHGG